MVQCPVTVEGLKEAIYHWEETELPHGAIHRCRQCQAVPIRRAEIERIGPHGDDGSGRHLVKSFGGAHSFVEVVSEMGLLDYAYPHRLTTDFLCSASLRQITRGVFL